MTMRRKQADTVRQETALGKISAAIEQALADAPAADVLAIITGAFVGLTVEMLRRQGLDSSKEIMIDGYPNRKITIHAPTQARVPDGQ
jgi:hypothetical protein